MPLQICRIRKIPLLFTITFSVTLSYFLLLFFFLSFFPIGQLLLLGAPLHSGPSLSLMATMPSTRHGWVMLPAGDGGCGSDCQGGYIGAGAMRSWDGGRLHANLVARR